MVVGHEGPALGVPKHRPLPSHGFGKQEGGRALYAEGRGVELVELHVHHPGAGPEGQGHAIARGHFGIGGVLEKLARPASADNNVPPAEGLALARFAVQGFHGHGTPVFGHQASGQRVFQDINVGLGNPRGQREFDVLAGGIAPGVKDTGAAVGSLHTQGNFAVAGVERDAPLDEAGNPLGPLAGEDFHRFPIAQTRPGGQRVLHVQGRRVAGAHRRRYAALGVAGITVFHPALGEDQRGAVFPRQQGGVKAGDAAANDDVIVVRAWHGGIEQRKAEYGPNGGRAKVWDTILPA